MSAVALRLQRPAQARISADRLEMLTALIAAPSFDPIFAGDVIQVPADHPTYRWGCAVPACARAQSLKQDLCSTHLKQWYPLREQGTSWPAFLGEAVPVAPWRWQDETRCRICPDLPASSATQLCTRHRQRWNSRRRRDVDVDSWCAQQSPLPGYGICAVLACPDLADSPIGLCIRHQHRYATAGSPGGAVLPPAWGQGAHPVQVKFSDKRSFVRWCRSANPISRNNGSLSLLGLRPLLRAEIAWLLFEHTKVPGGARWPLLWVQRLVNRCRTLDLDTLTEANLGAFDDSEQRVGQAMVLQLRVIYHSREDTKRAGFIETDHFGVRFTNSRSHFDLSGVRQVWLRDLLWDWMAARLASAAPPRSSTPFTVARRGCVELSAFLAAHTPAGGHDPVLLSGQDGLTFVADQRRRASDALPTLGIHRRNGTAAIATKGLIATTFEGVRAVLRAALDTGASDRSGLDREFIITIPTGKHQGGRRRPFPDDAARALADETNLTELAARDSENRGLRDIWEALIVTGRRASEIRQLRLECLGRYNSLAMLWHDQSKVGRYDQAIRIPETLHQRLESRQDITLERFALRYGRSATETERRAIALFPRHSANLTFIHAVSGSWFTRHFQAWVEGLDIGHCVPHQARHTLATSLLRNGATLSHVKSYLGQVSERMAEHYVHIANTDPALEDALNSIWVAGAGAPEPGRILSAGPASMTAQEAHALAIDLTRRSTPADGGFCTFQPVVNGNACPWNLNCHSCDKFVMSGADLLYWRRKQEQWATLAERAPDDATADYLHQVFAPTARAIDGLEHALTAAGLLEAALHLDLRRPQDYFARVWSLAFRPQDLSDDTTTPAPTGEPAT